MNDLFPIFLFFIFIVVSIFITIFNHERNLYRIRREIEVKGYMPGQIRRRWIDFDDNTATYVVNYANNEGRSFQTECKIRNIFIIPGQLYWTRPLQQELASGRSDRATALQYEVDALRKENAQLKRNNHQTNEPFSSYSQESFSPEDEISHLKATEQRTNIPAPRLELMTDLELEGLRKENTELKRQIRILRDQNKRYRKELGI